MQIDGVIWDRTWTRACTGFVSSSLRALQWCMLLACTLQVHTHAHIDTQIFLSLLVSPFPSFIQTHSDTFSSSVWTLCSKPRGTVVSLWILVFSFWALWTRTLSDLSLRIFLCAAVCSHSRGKSSKCEDPLSFQRPFLGFNQFRIQFLTFYQVFILLLIEHFNDNNNSVCMHWRICIWCCYAPRLVTTFLSEAMHLVFWLHLEMGNLAHDALCSCSSFLVNLHSSGLLLLK